MSKHAMKTLTCLLTAAVIGLGIAGHAAAAAPAAPGQTLAQRGAYLARVGDCVACHSAPGKPAFAGGLPIDSGLGVLYSTNITPDKEHGIGKYTEQQFADAVRKGVRADGTHLYPAMPYTSYAKVSDEDIKALYAYFQTGVQASAYAPPESKMGFPFNQRWGMVFWNFFFADNKPFKPQPGWSPQVRNGAYLVEGLGHCSTCHTPRGFAINEKASNSGEAKFLAGGELNGWPVPSLRGLPRWDLAAIVDYLQTGRNKNSAVAGEMTAVVQHSTSQMTTADLNDIAAYLKALPPAPAREAAVKPQGREATVKKLSAAVDLTLGERLYLDNCSACHFVTGKGATRVFPELDGASVVNAENPTALLHVMLAGARTPSTDKAPSVLVMPGFGKRLSDGEAAALASFLRQGWGNTAAAVSEKDVAKVRARIDAK
ncbi:mono/diheme cytochrome c family protein [Duganella sp. 1411]|uniref:c-type cytochrome n=1 Tax=Duganella sp. 1411 TaxID=2806572 RepID=UPI001B7A0D4E|nr:cytochrome c [Duganella sp. 1411]MBP1205136.1 mono/diheme cytochrome c family protein [Duganella sp. 1411]